MIRLPNKLSRDDAYLLLLKKKKKWENLPLTFFLNAFEVYKKFMRSNDGWIAKNQYYPIVLSMESNLIQ